MADDFGEKTEDATPKRRTEARQRGQIPRSQDLASVFALLVVTVALWALLTPSLDMLGRIMETLLTDAAGRPGDPAAAWSAIVTAGEGLFRVVAPLALLAWLGSYLSHFVQVGWLFSFETLQPSLSKLNPISGAKRIFGLSGLVKASLDSGKVAVVMAVAIITIHGDAPEIAVLAYLDPLTAMGRAGQMLFELAMKLLFVLLLLGAADFFYQKWKHGEDLKMTKQQVKDEMKSADGDPEVKKRRMRMAQQIAMQRVAATVPKADVIITNPEHISIAIQYDASSMRAPKVVAKGADYLAMRIRQIAMQHGIPIIERKPLARALYAQVDVGREVPPDFYQAVAEILAYVYRLSGKAAG
ncbi:MAG: flagellar biosynthesis protein FlhB [Phycisphaerales bacterium]|nr:flagellar biosynthesis protein FlhB [Phycisphaerales bacterium]